MSTSAEQERQLRERFKDDGLRRLVAANSDYYLSHGDYVPELAQLLLYERAALLAQAEKVEGLERALRESLNKIGDPSNPDTDSLYEAIGIMSRALSKEDTDAP